MEMETGKNLNWEITSKEAKSRTLQSIPLVVNVLFGFAVIMAIQAKSWTVLFVFVAIVTIYYFFTFIFGKFKQKIYKITETGIAISKGSKQKTYSWNDFECFYTHSLIINHKAQARDFNTRVATQDLINTSGRLSEVNGKTYYLKKKKQAFWDKFVKTFVVVRSEPENSKQVEETLATYLTHETFNNHTELGMTKYEFK